MDPVRSSLDWEDEDFTVEAILYEQMNISIQQSPMRVCQAQLKRSADRLIEGSHGDRVAYGNYAGLALLDEVTELRRDLIALTLKVEALTETESKRRDKELKRDEASQEGLRELHALKTKVTLLSRSSKDYLRIRKRFIAVYERDFKGRKDLKGYDAIQCGNLKAHGGDSVTDAILFNEDESLEKTVYEELYGLPYMKVLAWNESGVVDGGLFRALNAYATSLVQRKMTEEVTRAFKYFIAIVNQNWLQPPNREPNTPLYSAYYAYLNKHRELTKKN